MNARALPELDCQELVEVITDYLEGQLSSDEVERFEAHIAECSGCQMYLDQMRETVTALGHLPPESLSSEAEIRLLTAFRDWRRRR